ncbi:hypothetical protein AVEN_68244-1 [Araneus ventricosus]|uniref:Reverse transcriptase zinc-binding domain-containing protein n=1 Tax=Araneus ventricosus TaxID=182803 RepID=A0A4Y2VTR3_ARAVE|nr:hypothetical protein AVEN_68244-1 [Araneus ventricosus]
MAELFTGHGRFPAHLFRFGIGDDDRCACGAAEDAKHYIVSCPLTMNLRARLRPSKFLELKIHKGIPPGSVIVKTSDCQLQCGSATNSRYRGFQFDAVNVFFDYPTHDCRPTLLGVRHNKGMYYRTPSPCLRQRGHGQEWEGSVEESTNQRQRSQGNRPSVLGTPNPELVKLGARYVENTACPSSSLSVRLRPLAGPSHLTHLATETPPFRERNTNTDPHRASRNFDLESRQI